MQITGVNSLSPISSAAAPAPIAPEKAAENRDLVQAVKALNAAGSFGDNELTFQMDRKTKLPVIRIVDRKTKEVIDQIPPEYVLRLAEQLH